MNYEINQNVYTLPNFEIKKIIDREIIDVYEIYYMSDNTSYECKSLSGIEEINELILNNPKFSKFLFQSLEWPNGDPVTPEDFGCENWNEI